MEESQDKVATQEQAENSRADHLKPWQFKPGQSGNPGGRPKGSVSLKEFARKYLFELSEEEKLEFMRGLDKTDIWKLAEGNPKNDVDLTAKVTLNDVLNDIENGNRRQTTSTEVIGQVLATTELVQDTQQEQGISNIQPEQSTTPLPTEQVVEKYNPEE